MVATVFAFCAYLLRRAKGQQVITASEAASTTGLFVALAIWTVLCVGMGLRGIHAAPWLREALPLLWQAVVPVTIVTTWFFLSPTLRRTLRAVADHTPVVLLVFIQALRIGAVGSILKASKGVITSSFPYWVGIPDLVYGLSALLVGWLVLRRSTGHRSLAIWHIIGAAIILIPTFGFTNYWMNEPGFVFIFEFPMVLAPSLIVPILVALNIFAAWASLRAIQNVTEKSSTRRETTPYTQAISARPWQLGLSESHETLGE